MSHYLAMLKTTKWLMKTIINNFSLSIVTSTMLDSGIAGNDYSLGGRIMKPLVYLTGIGVLLWAAAAVRASDPVGVYARLDKVVLEPSADSPERIQIWGSFCLAKVRSNDDYAPPAKGYLYYKLDEAQKATCRKEWADLKKLAGTAQCVAFGARGPGLGTVRKAGVLPKDPDNYPLAGGLIKVDETNPQARALKTDLSQ
jgi:hypothetical protein